MSSKEVVRLLRESAVVSASKMLSDAQKASIIAQLKAQIDEIMRQQDLPLGGVASNVKAK